MVTLRSFCPLDAAALKRHMGAGMALADIQKLIVDWNQMGVHGKRFEMLAVIHDGEIVGMVSLYEQSKSVVSVGPEIFPAYRRQGLGKEAMRQALEAAKERGYSIAAQQVHCDNAASVILHQSLAFETSGYRYTNQKGNEVLIFLKPLF